MQKSKNTSGFISIIALGIFTILAVFGIILSTMISRNLSTVKNTENYNIARDTAQSVTDFLEKTLAQYEPGFNTPDGVSCVFNQAAPGANRGPNARPYVGDATFCEPLVAMVGNMKVTVNMEIKGRSTVEENLASGRCGTGPDLIRGIQVPCYTSPLPGTGDAGERCELYDPVFVGEGGANLPAILRNNLPQMDQLDYSCNWNKLTFGSSLTDRAAIPLYYSTAPGDCSDPDSESCVNPYWSGEDADVGGANKFLLRMRTPCLPCVYGDEQGVPGISRHCEASDDPSVCTNDQRYVLNEEDADDIVVQWQLNGLCDGEECGLIAIGEGENDEISAVKESRVNDQTRNYRASNYYVLIGNLNEGQDTTSGLKVLISQKLQSLKKPVLALFLSNALQSDREKNIPYLEYQFLSNKPIGSGKTKVHATVNVDGNIFEKDILIDVEKPLIDFAIQN